MNAIDVAKQVIKVFGNTGHTSKQLAGLGACLLDFEPGNQPERWHKVYGSALTNSPEFRAEKRGHQFIYYLA